VLARQERNRLPELLPLRHARMGASPFAFFRGAAAVMAADIAALPVTGLRVQTCGDAHLLNFGAYGSPERNLLFDVNDFDETLPGAWEWDVLRLVTSVELAARERAFSRQRTREAVLAVGSVYRKAMWNFAQISPLEIWYRHIDLRNPPPEVALPLAPQDLKRRIREARARTGTRMLAKLTASDPPRFIDQPPALRRIGLESPEAFHALDVVAQYRASLAPHVRQLVDRFTLEDVALKAVGVGSVGTRCMVALLRTERGDPLLLQLKEAEPSVWQTGAIEAGAHHGERVIAGQRLLQAASDVFLGWTTSNGIHYYVRQLRDMKDSVVIAQLDTRQMFHYARLCAWTLARAHARSGPPAEIAAYLGRSDAFDVSVAAFASTYADLTEADHRSMRRTLRQAASGSAAGD
jgi:uncharacterized protein (DUF2252 family)